MRRGAGAGAWGVVGVAALLLGGCFNLGPASPPRPIRLYLLQPLAAGVEPALEGLRLGVGLVTVARYLDRPNLISHGSDGEVVLDPFRRWAEPLDAQLARVLRRNLATLLGTDAVLGYPWRAAGSPDYQVAVEVERFDLDDRGTVHLDALWTVSAGERAAHPATRRTHCEEQAEATAEEHTVAAHSRAALCLSREIAADVRARALAGSP